MPATKNRDLASGELWQLSLERSRRRRVLAARVRKEQNRRKTVSVAVTAAVAAAPMWPSFAGGGSYLANAQAAKGAKEPNRRERVLLSFGDRSSAVAELQHELRILEDGIFGPQTQAAVSAFQKRMGLPATGEVDVRTWLAMFPNDAVVVAPASSTSEGGEPQWAALSSQGTGEAPADVDPTTASAAPPELTRRSKGKTEPRRRAEVHAASTGTADAPSADDGSTGSPTSGGVSVPIPPAPAPPATPPAPSSPAERSPAPSGGGTPPVGGRAPKPVVPIAPQPVVPIAPKGSIDQMIAAMIAEANRIDRARYGYRWGGGHNRSFSGPYDCSGAVSAVLYAAGLLRSPLVSGSFTRWGARGRGLVTIYANASHVYMSIRGRFFGTSRSNPGGGAGWFRGGPRPGFVVVHVPFEAMKRRQGGSAARKRVRRPVRRRAYIHAPRRTQPQAPPTNRGTRTGGTPAGTYQPPASSSPTTTATGSPPPQSCPTTTTTGSPPPQGSPTPAPPAAPGGAPSKPAGGSPAQAPPPQSGPKPIGVTTPAGSVTITPPTGPSAGGESPSGSGPTGPSAGGGNPSGSDPTGSPAPPAPSAPVDAPASPSSPTTPSGSAPGGPASSGGSSGSEEGSTATQPPSPPADPIRGAVDGVVAGADKAVSPVTSTLPTKAPEPPPSEPDPGEAASGSG